MNKATIKDMLGKRALDLFFSKQVAFSTNLDLKQIADKNTRTDYLDDLQLCKKYLHRDSDFFHTNVKEWYLIEPFNHIHPKYLEHYPVDIHLDSIYDHYGAPQLLNLSNPLILEILADINSSFYSFVRNYKNISSITIDLGYSVERVRHSASENNSSITILPDSSELGRGNVYKRITKCLKVLKNNLAESGYRNDIQLRILTYTSFGNRSAFDYVTDPQFIAEVLAETGCNLVLNASNIFHTTTNKGLHTHLEYIEQLCRYISLPSCLRSIQIAPPANRFPVEDNGNADISNKSYYENILNIFTYLLKTRYASNRQSPLTVHIESTFENNSIFENLTFVVDQLEEAFSQQNYTGSPASTLHLHN
jgi:hypothetical protein